MLCVLLCLKYDQDVVCFGCIWKDKHILHYVPTVEPVKRTTAHFHEVSFIEIVSLTQHINIL